MNSFSCLGSRSIGQNLFILVLLVMASGGAVARAGAIDAAQGVVVRILPEKSDEFVLEEIPAENQHDVFEIESSGGKIVLRGNNGVSIASAFNWYLKYYCNCQISWSGDQLRVPDPLPAVKAKVHIASPFLYRYDLNYCTHAYSMAWWDWNRWQRELDWMAMNGINLPLLITGEEGVWQATLSQLGYSDMEIKSWLTSPAHFPWQWMSNIQSWGGPLPQSWIDRRLDLARQIISRAKELGMSPVFQGYYGIVPAGFRDRFPNAHVLDQGDWSGFTRPQMLDPTDPIFAHVAETFYQQQQKLLGTAKFFSADPFHEGGSTRGLDVAKCAKAIQAEMFKVDPAATWVLQGWQGNPKEALLNGIDKDHALVLDLSGDSGNEWRRRNGFDGTPWAWCIVHNFGGRPGMFGNLAAIANGPPQAMRDPRANRLVGTGLLMEGIEQNPIVYDLMTEMGWRNQSPDLIQWVAQYADRRYGANVPAARQAWDTLRKTVYSSGDAEPLFLARPSLEVKTVDTWGSVTFHYSNADLLDACQKLLSCSGQFGSEDTYQYDLVVTTSQLLSNFSQKPYQELVAAFNAHDRQKMDQAGQEFLDLMSDEDELLSTRKEFLLGSWLEAARSWGQTDAEKNYYQTMARYLVTDWGPPAAARDLHEYSHRAWAGLVRDYYRARWQMFIQQLDDNLDGHAVLIDFVTWEQQWAQRTDAYPNTPTGNAVAVTEKLLAKYGPMIQAAASPLK